ncbi:Transposable element Tcb1 transposase [Portunus trituberculatus]|uniref:Transposable element Tcb1 transposase n=1 Tax=Portunus trituberculatus TaxID=210409 RepID=A0A5B7EHN9_PORTR|nr:Transposable element Tcb1 transposase [Portunus trituberculatus]
MKNVYLRLLKDKLATCFAVTGAEVFQQDGAPCRCIAHVVKEWIRENEVEVIPDWTPNSPDIPPIKKLKRIFKEENTSTEERLKEAIHRAWNAIPVATLQNLAASLPDHPQIVRKQKGTA